MARARRMSGVLWDTFTGSAPYRDVFVRDRQTGRTTRVSVASGGAQADQGPARPMLVTLEQDQAACGSGCDPRDGRDALQVEAAGWKGRRGSSLNQRDSLRRFFLNYATRASQSGGVRFGFLDIDGRPAAAAGVKQFGVHSGRIDWFWLCSKSPLN